MMRTVRENESGFTLLEVMIALFLLAFGMLGVATMQVSAIQGNSRGRQISEATDVASALMETLLSRAYDDDCLRDINGDATLDSAWAGRDLPNPDSAGICPNVPVNLPPAYNLFWNVIEDSPQVGTKTIRIFVEAPQTATFSIDMIRTDM